MASIYSRIYRWLVAIVRESEREEKNVPSPKLYVSDRVSVVNSLRFGWLSSASVR